MYRYILTALAAGVILVAFAMPLPMLTLGGSALAQKDPKTNSTNLNTSRSNVNRMGGASGTTTPKGGTTTTQQPATGGSTDAKTKSSKSNSSE